MGFLEEIPVGIVCVEEYEVVEEHTARHLGEEALVLSTPSMIAFMEKTSMKCVQQYLPEGLTTVGVLVNVRHLNPAPLGSKIRVESKLVARENRKLVFEVRAYHGNTLIGEGVHERYIVDRRRFAEKLKRSQHG